MVKVLGVFHHHKLCVFIVALCVDHLAACRPAEDKKMHECAKGGAVHILKSLKIWDMHVKVVMRHDGNG